MNADLPSHSTAVEEKLELQHRARHWTQPVYVAIPGVRTRRLRLFVPNWRLVRLRRKRGPLLVVVACCVVFLTVVVVSKGLGRSDWNNPWDEQTQGSTTPTLVFQRDDLQKIWKWEIASGHYPSSYQIPPEIGLSAIPLNPALPPKSKPKLPSKYAHMHLYGAVTETRGIGPKRTYLDIQAKPPNVAYPPRPPPGSVADLDHIMRHCGFRTAKYVRDCLEMLRLGGGLDNGERIRRDDYMDYHYIYREEYDNTTTPFKASQDDSSSIDYTRQHSDDPNEGLHKMKAVDWEPRLSLPEPLVHRPAAALPQPCDPDNSRLYHMFWTGPFTDKPYLAILSFLFTQNTGIHLPQWPSDANVCRPQFWLWINPGPAASVPNPTAVQDMMRQLRQNPWAAPFLHPRFQDVVKFKLWNTTEQLDGIPEIKDDWRELRDRLFNSGGQVYSVKQKPLAAPTSAVTTKVAGNASAVAPPPSDEDDPESRTGSKSSSSYDRLSVVLSDMARFVLCHRFGGIYLDADTILLRDWEELWGYKGAFAYRWSRLANYNTAVLRMTKGSALGTFLFRTALKNGLDFHPMTVSKYTADAYLEPLLLRLPDALFDAAWLNTEDYQRDRPPQPYFTEFSHFFDTPPQNSAAPAALGIRGFFRGSYSYHFHNFWWKPFDEARNFPDLGPRFRQTEEIAHKALRQQRLKASLAAAAVPTQVGATGNAEGEKVQPPMLHDDVEIEDIEDKKDLPWSAVLKRTFEGYLRGERPNMYGEWIHWDG